MTAARGTDTWFAGSMAALAVATGTLFGMAVGALPGAAAGAAAGAGMGALLWRALTARAARRERVRRTPFPEAWRRILEERYDHYHRLPATLRPRFEVQVALFLAEKRITGVEVEVDEELRVLVAASAATLTAAWEGDDHWNHLAEVLLYRRDFGRDYSFDDDDLSGQAHPWGTVILSVPTLQDSFDDPDDGFHVALHEFAHLLDVEQTHFDGVPRGLDAETSRQWLLLVDKELDRLRRGKSVLDPYAAEDPVEFLAVAVETFFERPLALRRRHREVYALLRDYFAQDPAEWDDRRGLEEY
ncbi:MAG TPA: zinc-dependent peptidase [Vicinamibacteria bacterium]|nr:zinc-dependent peptidase [Vicinamibacteria bacterium]